MKIINEKLRPKHMVKQAEMRKLNFGDNSTLQGIHATNYNKVLNSFTVIIGSINFPPQSYEKTPRYFVRQYSNFFEFTL